jgi:hypothetical protein
MQSFVAGFKTALREELFKAMPVPFMEAYRQALALERIRKVVKYVARWLGGCMDECKSFFK